MKKTILIVLACSQFAIAASAAKSVLSRKNSKSNVTVIYVPVDGKTPIDLKKMINEHSKSDQKVVIYGDISGDKTNRMSFEQRKNLTLVVLAEGEMINDPALQYFVHLSKTAGSPFSGQIGLAYAAKGSALESNPGSTGAQYANVLKTAMHTIEEAHMENEKVQPFIAKFITNKKWVNSVVKTDRSFLNRDISVAVLDVKPGDKTDVPMQVVVQSVTGKDTKQVDFLFTNDGKNVELTFSPWAQQFSRVIQQSLASSKMKMQVTTPESMESSLVFSVAPSTPFTSEVAQNLLSDAVKIAMQEVSEFELVS
jgi:hypothetical protein